MPLENISCNKSAGGWHKQYTHRSEVLNCDMRFAIYLPPQCAAGKKVLGYLLVIRLNLY